MADTLPAPYGDEMKGISQASGLPLGKLKNEISFGFIQHFLKFIISYLDRKLYLTAFDYLGEVVLYNIFYEVSSLCTSIVGQDQNGNIFHGRNLDFGGLMG